MKVPVKARDDAASIWKVKILYNLLKQTFKLLDGLDFEWNNFGDFTTHKIPIAEKEKEWWK